MQICCRHEIALNFCKNEVDPNNKNFGTLKNTRDNYNETVE